MFGVTAYAYDGTGNLLTVTDAKNQVTTLAFAGHPAGRQLLVVTGLPAGYANLVAPVDLIANTANVLPSPVTTPPLDLATAVTVNPAATTTLTSATAHVTVVIPPGRAKNADGTPYTGQLTISPVPEYGRPESRPVELRPGLSVTIQPAGVILDPPVPITFPNVDNMPPGNEFDLWSLYPDTGTFLVVGRMRVSADGATVEMIPGTGGVRKTAWHFAMPPGMRREMSPKCQARKGNAWPVGRARKRTSRPVLWPWTKSFRGFARWGRRGIWPSTIDRPMQMCNALSR